MFKPMTIGQYTVKYPLIQGGMGVRVSGGSLAGHVARCGGVGLVAAAGIALNSPFFHGNDYLQAEPEAFKAELKKAYEIAPDGIIGVNVMVALADSMVRSDRRTEGRSPSDTSRATTVKAQPSTVTKHQSAPKWSW